MALRSWASTLTGAEVRLSDQPAVHLDSRMALGVDQLVPTHPDVKWHSAFLNAGWLNKARKWERKGEGLCMM